MPKSLGIRNYIYRNDKSKFGNLYVYIKKMFQGNDLFCACFLREIFITKTFDLFSMGKQRFMNLLLFTK